MLNSSKIGLPLPHWSSHHPPIPVLELYGSKSLKPQRMVLQIQLNNGGYGSGSIFTNNQIDGTATIDATGPNISILAAENRGGNLSGTPFTVTDPDLGSLGNNGGPTETILPNSSSSALGVGSVAVATSAGLTKTSAVMIELLTEQWT